MFSTSPSLALAAASAEELEELHQAPQKEPFLCMQKERELFFFLRAEQKLQFLAPFSSSGSSGEAPGEINLLPVS